jgi:probable phosphoglycerate mutase
MLLPMPHFAPAGPFPARAGATLYLVRHGRTAYNREGIVQGRRIDATLDDTGRRQAAALADRFADVPLDALYTSAMRRARQTACPVAARHPGLAARPDEDLEEMSWGRLEGEAPTEAVRGALNDIKDDWRSGHLGRAARGGGESALDVQARAMRAVRRIFDDQPPGATVLVVAHGRFLRVLIASLLPARFGLRAMHRVEHANTGVNHLTYDAGGACSARLLNCTAHLDPTCSPTGDEA